MRDHQRQIFVFRILTCGIAGFYGAFDPDFVVRMGSIIAHRDPDDSGMWFSPDKQIGFAHRRLSIINVFEWGHRPMSDADGRAVIIYIGEFYNYRELKEELEANAVRFRGKPDAEVVL